MSKVPDSSASAEPITINLKDGRTLSLVTAGAVHERSAKAEGTQKCLSTLAVFRIPVHLFPNQLSALRGLQDCQLRRLGRPEATKAPPLGPRSVSQTASPSHRLGRVEVRSDHQAIHRARGGERNSFHERPLQ